MQQNNKLDSSHDALQMLWGAHVTRRYFPYFPIRSQVFKKTSLSSKSLLQQRSKNRQLSHIYQVSAANMQRHFIRKRNKNGSSKSSYLLLFHEIFYDHSKLTNEIYIEMIMGLLWHKNVDSNSIPVCSHRYFPFGCFLTRAFFDAFFSAKVLQVIFASKSKGLLHCEQYDAFSGAYFNRVACCWCCIAPKNHEISC